MTESIWIVFEGCYSDRHVSAVFTKEQSAKQYCNDTLGHNSGNYFDIEEWKPDEYQTAVEKIANGYKHFDIKIKRDGTVTSSEESTSLEHAEGERGWIFNTKISGPHYQIHHLGWPEVPDGFIRIRTWQKTLEGAVKVANEHRAALIASNRWRTGEEIKANPPKPGDLAMSGGYNCRTVAVPIETEDDGNI